MTETTTLHIPAIHCEGCIESIQRIVERKGAQLGLITTTGFRDIIELRDGSKQNRYDIRMAPTGRAPGAIGYVTKTFAQSPFGIAVSVDGRYIYEVSLAVKGLRGPPNVEYTVWVAPPNLSPIVRLGVLDEQFELSGQVDFNKFIMFVTAEQPGSWDPDNGGKKTGNAWAGPILMQGISRSGMMHSAAGHGPFEVENC